MHEKRKVELRKIFRLFLENHLECDYYEVLLGRIIWNEQKFLCSQKKNIQNFALIKALIKKKKQFLSLKYTKFKFFDEAPNPR